ncbi:MAG: hypothetical protein GYA24_08215 [Candidatus Lokiarchaeota archaeon]|nr:hypothetical protein [Candidatus Lokiarchaeota archaeon]
MLQEDPVRDMWIVAIVAAVTFFFIIVIEKLWITPGRKKRVKRQTKDYLTGKFDDLMALRAILVARKDSGVLLHSYVVECDDNVAVKSPDFLSGVVYAIQNLGKEMGFQEQFSRLAYGDYHIVASQGQRCTVILVSRTEPSSILQDNMLLLVRSFEKKFAPKLQEDTVYVNTGDYEGAISIIRDIFDTFYIENLNLIYNPDATKPEDVTKLGRLVLDHALAHFKKNNSICLKNIFIDMLGSSDADVRKKWTKDDLVQEMYDLFKANYFTFFNT